MIHGQRDRLRHDDKQHRRKPEGHEYRPLVPNDLNQLLARLLKYPSHIPPSVSIAIILPLRSCLPADPSQQCRSTRPPSKTLSPGPTTPELPTPPVSRSSP